MNPAKRRFYLLLALILPIAVLSIKAIWHSQQRSIGTEIRLPIYGFDPRDLLSGHYLIYRVEYDLPELCQRQEPLASEATTTTPSQTQTTEICLQPRNSVVDASCTLKLQGQCERSGEFIAGIERFYIPEEHARALEGVVMNRQGELVVNIQQNKAYIKTLLIDGESWLDFIKKPPPQP